MIRITDDVAIPDEEVTFATSRSGGPGGQNVNKLETRVTLRFDLAASGSLTEEQKARLLERLSTRITRAGILHVSAQKHRTQGANRDAALERFAELVRDALREETPRKKTRTSRAAKARRVEEKRRHSERKRNRSAPVPID
ncbi:MAG TPA: alternative ribosome rescue aminoacyl-tRNA hydrolase ArfB [Thermoanaerobaculia bacterium]|nr:alternative ribosome rescue aminoacyl-tRNA hydrolase ArfB [Thermoanaerobaculia bacterium]